MVKSLLAAALAVVSLAHADVFSFSASGSDTGPPAYRHLDLTGELSVPRFDPAMGTLNSVNFSLSLYGVLYWDLLSGLAPMGRYTPTVYDIQTRITFLETIASQHNGGPVAGSGIFENCELPAYPTPCPVVMSYISGYQYLLVAGQITAESSSVNSGQQVFTAFAGAPPADLTSFIGIGSVALPIAVGLDGDLANGPSGKSSFTLGGLSGDQSLKWNLDWNYDYSPNPVVTPEPRGYAALLALLLITALVLRRVTAHHIRNRRACVGTSSG